MLSSAPRRLRSVAPLLRQALPLLVAIIREGRLAVLPRLLIGELHKFPDLARFYKASVADGALALIARMHREGVVSGEFRDQDSEAVARLVVVPVLMTAVRRAVFAPHEAEPFDLARVLETHADVLLRGLAP